MTETTLLAMIGVLGTIASGLGATFLANRHAARQGQLARQHELRGRARTLIVETLVEARAWKATAMGVSMAVATSSSITAVDHYLTTSLIESESFGSLREHRAAFERAATEAKLLIADPKLSAVISTLLDLEQEWWETVIDPARDALEQGTTDKVERLRHWISFEARFDYGLDALERLTREAIASAL